MDGASRRRSRGDCRVHRERFPHYASVFCLNIIARAERLELFPMLGRIVPEMNDPAIREVLMGNYRIIYRLVGEAIQIVSIYHGSRILNPDKLALPE